MRRPALGGLRAGVRPRADRHRRGARRLVQAGGRPALRRPPGGRAARRRRPAPCCWPAPRRRGRRAGRGSTRLSMPERVDAPRAAAGRAGRHRRHDRRRCTRARATRSRACATRGEKAIVLLNRRGWSNFLSLPLVRARVGVPAVRRHAGAAPRGRARVAATTAATASACPTACPDCGSVSVARHGAGTERLEQELTRAGRPAAGVPARRRRRRPGAGAILDVLRRFDQAPAGVLVGTQMVAKGHDFPDVTLGVVHRRRLDAALPRLPRRGAHVRAGRAARRALRPRRRAAGRVIVQALDTDARALRYAAAHDAEGFLDGRARAPRAARATRRSPSLIRVVCSAREPGPEARAARRVAARLELPGVVGARARRRCSG